MYPAHFGVHEPASFGRREIVMGFVEQEFCEAGRSGAAWCREHRQQLAQAGDTTDLFLMRRASNNPSDDETLDDGVAQRLIETRRARGGRIIGRHQDTTPG
jgi:hypothetical protein